MKTKNRLIAWLSLLIIVLAAFTVIAVPVWLIRPFAPQTQRGLAISFALKSWAPVLTAIAAITAFAIVIWLWRNSARWWGRAFLLVPLSLVVLFAWFARQNHFEWMFNPLENSAYAKAADAEFVKDSDMVIAVKINGEAAAYTVRLMAYHHIVEDVVGGVRIAATY